MITRPLDLAARLRPEPRSFDGWFFVNGGLIVLFFALFGSRFVLTPAVGVDFRLPRVAGAKAGAVLATHYVTVDDSGLIIGPGGVLTIEQLRRWLREQAPSVAHPMLQVHASELVDLSVLARIKDAADAARFQMAISAVEPATTRPPTISP